MSMGKLTFLVLAALMSQASACGAASDVSHGVPGIGGAASPKTEVMFFFDAEDYTSDPAGTVPLDPAGTVPLNPTGTVSPAS